MRTKKIWPRRLSISKAGFVVIFLLKTLILFSNQGCNPECDDCQPSSGLPPSIAFSLVKGGQVETQTENEASITVFRKDQLQVLYQIDIPNGFLDAMVNNEPIGKYEMHLGTNGKTAHFSYLPSDIHTEIPQTLVIRDQKLKSTTFTFHPVYELGLNPEDIVDGSWQKIHFDEFQESGPLRRLIGTADKSILAIYGNDIYKGTEDGRTWKKVPVEGVEGISWVVPHPSGDLYAAGWIGGWGPFYLKMYKSTDHGDTWWLLNTNLPSYEVSYEPMEVSKEGTYQMYVTDPTGQHSGIWISQDGEKWSLPSDFFKDLTDSYWLQSLSMINDSTTFMLINSGYDPIIMVRSFDYGKTWQYNNLPGQSIHNLFCSNNGNIYIYGSEIYVSKNLGETWHKMTDGLPDNGILINSIAEGTDGKIYIAPQDYGVFKLEGDQWKSVGTDLAIYNAFNFFTAGESFYTIVQPSNLYKLE